MLKLEEVLEKLTEAFNWDSDKDITLMALQDYFSDLSQLQNNQLNRVEIIDKKGRSYVNWNKNNKIELSYQDSGRTLKIFINDSN
jgi:hypothetical protein